jgi:GxxExxY protein
MDGPIAVLPELTRGVLKAAFEVHRNLGPGLLESTYRECLVRELKTGGHSVEREVPIPIDYKDLRIDGAYRADLIVDGAVIVELKAVDQVLPVHEAQTLTYLKLSGLKVALLLNFNTRRLQHGIRRFVT